MGNAPLKTGSPIVYTVRIVLPLFLLGIGSQHASAQKTAMPAEDYRTARRHFQTHLLRHGPSPVYGAPMHPPPGAQQIEYAPTLHLQAWISSAVTQPTSGAKMPAVLFLHGHCAIDKSDWEKTQPYRQAGYIVMMPALRGENGQHGEYSMFYDEVEDVQAAADYLAKLPNVDPTHLYLAGHSVGGTLVLLTALTSSRFRAAAAFSGAPDAKVWSQNKPELIVFDAANAQEFRMRSPLAFAGSFRCPTRLYCGRSEPVFSRLSRQTSAQAKKQGRDVETIHVPGDHFTALPEEIRQSIRFFQSH